MVWGEAQFALDLRVLIMGGSAVPVMVTGGTGIYEDAYGWIVLIAADGYLDNFSVDGRICGPNISND
jgi:hypothetical protein